MTKDCAKLVSYKIVGSVLTECHESLDHNIFQGKPKTICVNEKKCSASYFLTAA